MVSIPLQIRCKLRAFTSNVIMQRWWIPHNKRCAHRRDITDIGTDGNDEGELVLMMGRAVLGSEADLQLCVEQNR